MRAGEYSAHNQVSVGTTATQIVPSGTERGECIVKNHDASTTMYVGNSSSVTTSNGLAVAAGESFIWRGQSALYGITAAGTVVAAYLEVR